MVRRAISIPASTDNKLKDLLARSERLRLQSRIIRTRAATVRRRNLVDTDELPALSARERQVLALLSAGLTTKDLALQLGISANTARYHLTNLYRKLGAHSRVEAANAFFGRAESVGHRSSLQSLLGRGSEPL